jgi:lipoprotein-anchoring transpeptidase ErfK/SrfK
MPVQSSRRKRPHQVGAVVLRALVLVGAAALAWVWWEAGRSDSTKSSSTANASGQAVVATNPPPPPGSLVFPVTDKSGRALEPVVLVPVEKRAVPEVPPTAAAVTNAPVTASSARVTGGLSLPGYSAAFDERILQAQIALAGLGISSGSLDGLKGGQTRAALRAFQKREGLTASGELDQATATRLALVPVAFTDAMVSATDLARLLPLGRTWLAKSQQERMDYETTLEMVSEQTRTNPKLVQALNPQVDWSRFVAGTTVRLLEVPVPTVEKKAAFLRIFIGDRALQAFDENTNLLAHFPCSIASRVEKRPIGEVLHIAVVAPNPNYTFDPDVFPESAEARELGRKLILQPGPNNPVGTVWIGLDKPGYGIHGTPVPEQVGRTESHGCFRLANWNAEHLLKLVSLGLPVIVEP